VSVSSELGRVRQVARQDKDARFTALLHHVTVDRLRAAYRAIRPNAAPGTDGVKDILRLEIAGRSHDGRAGEPRHDPVERRHEAVEEEAVPCMHQHHGAEHDHRRPERGESAEESDRQGQ